MTIYQRNYNTRQPTLALNLITKPIKQMLMNRIHPGLADDKKWTAIETFTPEDEIHFQKWRREAVNRIFYITSQGAKMESTYRRKMKKEQERRQQEFDARNDARKRNLETQWKLRKNLMVQKESEEKTNTVEPETDNGVARQTVFDTNAGNCDDDKISTKSTAEDSEDCSTAEETGAEDEPNVADTDSEDSEDCSTAEETGAEDEPNVADTDSENSEDCSTAEEIGAEDEPNVVVTDAGDSEDCLTAEESGTEDGPNVVDTDAPSWSEDLVKLPILCPGLIDGSNTNDKTTTDFISSEGYFKLNIST